MWVNNCVDRNCVRHFTSSVISYFSGVLLVCHCYLSIKINSIFFQFRLCDIVWCVTYLFVWSCIGSLMCCLHISNRYSRISVGCVQSVYTPFFQMRYACGGWRSDLGGQSQGDVASPLIRYSECLHNHVVMLLEVSQFWECTYSSSDNEINVFIVVVVLNSQNF